MVEYQDNVDASLMKLKELLTGSFNIAFIDAKKSKNYSALLEMTIAILDNLTTTSVQSSNQVIDQISGRIEKRLEELGLKDFRFPSSLFEQAKSLADTNDKVFKVLEQLKAVNMQSKLQELATFLTSDDQTTNESDNTKEFGQDETEKEESELITVSQYIDKQLLKMNFLDTLMMYVSHTVSNSLSQVFKVDEQVTKANNALAKTNIKLAIQNFMLARSNDALATSNLALATSTFSKASAILLDAGANLLLAGKTMLLAGSQLVLAAIDAVLAVVNIALAIVTLGTFAAFVVLTVAYTATIAALNIATSIAIAAMLVSIAAITVSAFALATATIILAVLLSTIAISLATIVAGALVVVSAAALLAGVLALGVIFAALNVGLAVSLAAIAFSFAYAIALIAAFSLQTIVAIAFGSFSLATNMMLFAATYGLSMLTTTMMFSALTVSAAMGLLAGMLGAIAITIVLMFLLVAYLLFRAFTYLYNKLEKWWSESKIKQWIDAFVEWWDGSSLKKWLEEKISSFSNSTYQQATATGGSIIDAIKQWLTDSGIRDFFNKLRDLLSSADNMWNALTSMSMFKDMDKQIDNALTALENNKDSVAGKILQLISKALDMLDSASKAANAVKTEAKIAENWVSDSLKTGFGLFGKSSLEKQADAERQQVANDNENLKQQVMLNKDFVSSFTKMTTEQRNEQRLDLIKQRNAIEDQIKQTQAYKDAKTDEEREAIIKRDARFAELQQKVWLMVKYSGPRMAMMTAAASSAGGAAGSSVGGSSNPADMEK